MKKLFVALLFFFPYFVFSQNKKTENIVIVTLDGMRWQEIFGGIDTALVFDKQFTRDTSEVISKFWSIDAEVRRKKLFPFLWTTVAQQGQLYGNRIKQSYVNVLNRYRFSYPGYNEIFTGYPDTAVNSNDKIANRNKNVLEFINNQKSFKGKVAAFSTWDVFPYILNAQRSGVYVNADVDTLKFNSSPFKLINDIQFLTARPIGVRPDVLTYIAAREYLKQYKPKVLYIAFDETDDFAHEGSYDQYLKSAHAEDAMLADLWNTIQQIPQYKNKTTFIITCDHGRGNKVKKEWMSHGTKIEGADEIWMAFLGNGINGSGEAKQSGQLYQAQLAQTLAQLLGFTYTADHPIEKSISTITGK